MSTLKLSHTPGPWGWFGNTDGSEIYLSTIGGGRRFVMRFVRWGMAKAQPTFQVNHRMVEAKHLVKFEVGSRDVTGVEAAKQDGSVYRMDVTSIDHPDARLIAAAPDLLEAAIAVVAANEAGDGNFDHAFGQDLMNRLKSAVEKATAPPPTYTRAELDALNAASPFAKQST